MPRRTKAEAEATREALLDAAEDVFLEKGVSRTSLEHIARHAGMTRGAVYWHFKNKADLFHAMLDRVKMPLQQIIDDITAERQASGPLNTLRLATLHAFEMLERPRSCRVHTILIHRCEFISDINPVELQNRLASDCREVVRRCFQQAHDEGLLIDEVTPDVATLMLHSMIGGLVHDWLRTPDNYSLSAHGGEAIDNLFYLITRHAQV
ncbi:TetR family transcriptional regulator [Chromohalobacter marismortui]|uniref:TetR family transcriptional regulator n=1 Tax=Chromohalobacter marismortui TaxID=42055 RepID=A0A4R7NTB3_9GAMM|nr:MULTISPECIES: TetR family transcriptional regulator [Chromohalobacter]MCI0511313.1 TetR family transcriptional regulator [Chromohalobacter sp.]MCI0594075.1 TetR family transcriptional regulator [Chromohalobacter sp.]TDU23670.1 TetR family transcriptional regulator [Chromohalobacter marismortui]